MTEATQPFNRAFHHDRFRARLLEVESQVRAAHANALSARFGERLALVAVGGFGRSELFPYSDIDILVLVDHIPDNAAERDALAAFQRQLWDGQLRLSQGLRTIDECTRLDELDVERTISLLDRRFLAGSEDLWRKLQERLPKFLESKRATLDRHVCRLATTRHTKFQHTIYHLEPDLKEGPGGLRDLNLLHWLREDTLLLEPSREFLYQTRFGLHDAAGRDSNVLTFDFQESLAPNTEAGPDALMRAYYHHARLVFRAALRAVERHEGPASGLLNVFRDFRSRVSNADFTVSKDRVLFRAPRGATDVALKLRLFEFLARHGLRLSAEAEDRVLAGRIAMADSPPPWSWWREMLAQPHAAVALRAMHETGAMAALMPEWEHLESLVTRDFYHRYTVDEHTLVTLETLEKLPAATEPAIQRFAELWTEAEGVPLLRFALLLHDIGKGTGKEHSAESERIAREVLARWNAPPHDAKAILFLIEHHLDLSTIATSRDLSDPAVIEEAAHRVETLEQLKLLTLLTFADISAVNPSTMTPWRAEQLWRAYRTIRRELTRELGSELIHAAPSERPEVAAWLEGFPTRYLRTHNLADIERHFALGQLSESLGVAVELRKQQGAWELTVAGPDRPGVFAALAGALASFGFNILKVEAFANRQGRLLDVFHFADPLRTLDLNPSEVDTVRKRATQAAKGELDVPRLLKSRPKPKKLMKLTPVVEVTSRENAKSTLVEIVSEDRPGLLYDLASAIYEQGCSIDVVLIETEATKAIDVFYVSRAGGPLSPEEAAKLASSLEAAVRPA
ncbi:MAG: HD domain-containing protein [Bryobacteraceae bacterium]|nr:HD domain-containing protein [Bryobacteraceae bacterium]